MKKIYLLCVLLLSACASSSQDAKIDIYPSITASNIGNGVALSIIVDDARPTAVIGSTGKNTQITTSQDLAETIGLALVDAYTKQGFSVSGQSDPNAIKVMVALEDLSYTKDGSLVTTNVETRSRVKVDVSEKGFVRTYTNSEERVVPFSASEDSNNSQLRSIMERMVEKIINDAELLGVLTR